MIAKTPELIAFLDRYGITNHPLLSMPVLFVTNKAVQVHASLILGRQIDPSDVRKLASLIDKHKVLCAPLWRTLQKQEVLAEFQQLSTKYPPNANRPDNTPADAVRNQEG